MSSGRPRWAPPLDLARASATGAKQGALMVPRDHQAVLKGARRAANRVSNSVVLALMTATSAVALLDLYLLATGLPR